MIKKFVIGSIVLGTTIVITSSCVKQERVASDFDDEILCVTSYNDNVTTIECKKIKQ